MKVDFSSAVRRWSRTHIREGTTCGVALISLVCGSILTAQLTRADPVSTQSNHVYQLLVYHAVPGKVAALVSRFHDASQLQAKHGLRSVGYWVPEGDPAFADTFIYVLVHRSQDDARQNWAEFHADPAFHKYVDAETAEPLIDKVDSVYMRPTDYSASR